MRQRPVQIVCTIGPASREHEVLEGLVAAGMRVARLNFAHGQPEEHRETAARIRAASQRLERPVAILQDLAGPKLRLGELATGRMQLRAGEEVELRCGTAKAEAGVLPVADETLAEEVSVGGPVLLGDGAVELQVVRVQGASIHCRVVVEGEITSGKGINVPGGLRARPVLDEKDAADLEIGAEIGVDLVGVSYVRTAADLASVRRRLRGLGRPTPLVAKLETGLALRNLDEILAHTDAVMIARGDLSLEIPLERVPVEQKRIVRAAIRSGRPVITATQMLQSMVSASRPTRAEATDVANAVLDGTDAVMLSDETAIGVDPVRACRTMARIIEETHEAFPEFPDTPPEGVAEELKPLAVFARAAVRTAHDTGAIAIVTWSRGGAAARLLSRQRPRLPIVAPTRLEESWRRLALLYGVSPVLCPSGVLRTSQLEELLGPVDPAAELLVVGHFPGEQRRIPYMGLARVADRASWSRDPREEGPRWG